MPSYAKLAVEGDFFPASRLAKKLGHAFFKNNRTAPEFSVPLISGKLCKHACLKKKFLCDHREFNQITVCVGDF